MNPNTNTTVEKVSREDRTMEYVPFGSEDKIKLSVKIIQDIVCIPTKSGHVCDEREAMKFMMLCKARALNPFEGDGFLMGYEGQGGKITWSLITAHQAFLKRAEPHPEFAGMRSGVVLAEYIECPACKGESKLKNGKPCRRCNEMGVSDEYEGDIVPKGATLLGGWATVFFKNRPEPMHKRVALAVFKKPFGRWNDDPAGMIVKCAEADALRSSFPTRLGGLYLKEEIDAVEAAQPAMPTPGIFGQIKPTQVDVEPAPTQTASSEPEPTTKPKKAKATEKPAEQPPAPASSEPAASPAPAASGLRNDKTQLAAWMHERNLGWATLQPIIAREFGNWADSIAEFDQLSMQQAKVIFNSRGDIEKELGLTPA